VPDARLPHWPRKHPGRNQDSFRPGRLSVSRFCAASSGCGEPGRTGRRLDARARGLLLHTLMKELWSELKGSEGLHGDCGPAIERAAAVAVREAKIEEPFAGLERKRLAKLAREWLEVERSRPPFEVVAMEEKRKLAVAGLELNGRIDRMTNSKPAATR